MNDWERNLGALLWSFETSFKVSQSRRPSSISGMKILLLVDWCVRYSSYKQVSRNRH
jgi:hypothetical protein